MEIALGIFSHMNKKALLDKNISIYPFTSNEVIDNSTYIDCCDVMSLISIALSRCTKCYFYFDGIKLPLSKDSYTCMELEFILDHEYILDKVQFILANEEITQKQALTFLNRFDLII